MTFYPFPPDRHITELYAVICIDPKTGLEGLCAIGLDHPNFGQVVTSNKDVAYKMLERIKARPETGQYNFEVRKFTVSKEDA